MRSDVLDGARLHLVSGHPPSGPASRTPLQRWAHPDSNQDLTGYEPAALPLSYGPTGIIADPAALAPPRRAGHDSRKLLSFFERDGCRSFRSALASICRMRSRVTAKSWPTSSS